MLAKLLSLLIHAKSGAISGVLLLGATGALVSVSAANGVTTITITEASPSPSASVNHQQTTTASHTPTPSPSSATPTLSSPSTSTACTDETNALALQVKRVDTAFSGFHTDLMKLRGQRTADVLMKADKTLKLDRESAVRAIHATATAACLKQDDEDEKDTDVDEKDTDDAKPAAAAPATTVAVVGEVKHGDDNDKDNDNDGDKSKTALITFTGDAASIADQAIAAMQTAFDAAKNAPVTTPKPERNSTNGSKVVPSKSPDHKGDHHD